MPNYAHLAGNVVQNILVADTAEDAELVTGSRCVPYTTEQSVNAGMVYDDDTKEFSWPVETPTGDE